MTQPEALRLADEIEGDYDPDWLYEIGVDEIAAELRRLHAECNDLARQLNESNERNGRLKAQRIALLEALKKAEENGCATVYSNEDDECGDRGCCGVTSFKPHADDCWVTTARAAIRARGEKK